MQSRTMTNPPQSASAALIGGLCNSSVSLIKELAELKRDRHTSRRPPSRPPYNRRPRSLANSRNRDEQTQGPGICYYHRRFKKRTEATNP